MFTKRNNRRINLIDNGYQEENDDDEEYDEYDDNYENFEYEKYDDSQVYQFDRELYEKDNHQIKERRRSNRLNLKQGWQTFGKPDLKRKNSMSSKQNEYR